jgi:hypothetical protein
MSREFCNYVSGDLRGMHPLAYRAARRVMHLSALFRHVRQNDANRFAAFRASLDGAVVVPAVLTPTEMRIY